MELQGDKQLTDESIRCRRRRAAVVVVMPFTFFRLTLYSAINKYVSLYMIMLRVSKITYGGYLDMGDTFGDH